VSPELGIALGAWQRGQATAVRWCKPEGLHLTLAFLGERTAAALRGLELCAEAVAGRHRAFGLRTAGLGGFPRGEAARVLWLGLGPEPRLDALVADLRRTLAAAGEAFDPKPFRAHLTLARFRQSTDLLSFEGPPPSPFPAARLVLFESRPGGRYSPLRIWPLRPV
jgi:2'-5' RNA ligase